MKRITLDYDFDLGNMGRKMGRILADIEGMRVELLAANVGDEENGNILDMLNFSTIQDIKMRIREKYGQPDVVHDWEGPSNAS